MKVTIIDVPKAKDGIHIKKSKVGSLHEHLGVAKDKKIPASKLAIKPGDSPAIRKKKQFALNARKWKHDDGGSIPEFDYTDDLQVEDNQVEYLSPHTMLLGGNTHEEGGTDIMYAGQPVEAEKGETVHVDKRDGSAVVGGNLYTQALGGKMKYKAAFSKIAKEEQKNSKLQDKASYLLNNFSPDYRTTAPTFNTGKVLADAYEQKKAITEADKNYLTDEQNFQLELAERSGQSPKKVNGAIMKADKGWDSKRKGIGEQRLRSEKRVPNPYWNPFDFSNKMPVQPTYVPTAPVKTIGKKVYTSNKPAGRGFPKFVGQGRESMDIPGQSAIGYTPGNITYPGYEEYVPETGATSLYDTGNTEATGYTQGDMGSTDETGSTKGLDKKRMKGLREKFNPMNYLAEITSFLDSPDPVPSIQTRAIMEPEYNLSLQGKKNSIISAYKPAIDSARKNPAQQAAIAGQMAEQLAQVDGEELALNQQNTGAIRARNLQELRQVRDMNTQLTAQQMDRQVQARAITKENKFNAAQAIDIREAQRRAYNNRYGMSENYRGWVQNPETGEYQMIHPAHQYEGWKVGTPDMNDYNHKKKNKKYSRDAKGHVTEEYDIEEDNKRFGGYIAARKPGGVKKGKKPMKYC